MKKIVFVVLAASVCFLESDGMFLDQRTQKKPTEHDVKFFNLISKEARSKEHYDSVYLRLPEVARDVERKMAENLHRYFNHYLYDENNFIIDGGYDRYINHANDLNNILFCFIKEHFIEGLKFVMYRNKLANCLDAQNNKNIYSEYDYKIIPLNGKYVFCRNLHEVYQWGKFMVDELLFSKK